MTERRGVVVFDINETTLDMAPVRAVVDEVLGPDAGFSVWFPRLLQLSMTCTAIDRYVDFSTIARSALEATAATVDRSLPDDAWDRVAAAIGSIEPHADVRDGLNRLRADGWSTMALTNSAPSTVDDHMQRNDLADLFDHVLTVEPVGAYKPDPRTYRHAADVVRAELGSMWMVACHDWDLAGAHAVGMKTAFVERPSMKLASALPSPDLSVRDFVDLAERLDGLSSI